jgi:hypothetical protein
MGGPFCIFLGEELPEAFRTLVRHASQSRVAVLIHCQRGILNSKVPSDCFPIQLVILPFTFRVKREVISSDRPVMGVLKSSHLFAFWR